MLLTLAVVVACAMPVASAAGNDSRTIEELERAVLNDPENLLLAANYRQLAQAVTAEL